ncbi:MAG: HDOD domain-containing protein [Rhodocyclaceae bacterium]|nr:HDOD domain-containing protein [Rhodocyclaceae bacterium]MCO5098661.1 HDOD domain-containing protein [Rhodocyclaceae bacterium]
MQAPGATMDVTDFFDADFSDATAIETLRNISVPPCPDIIVELLREARNEDIDFIRISRLITGDVALAAAVMKSANSPFFALRRKVQSVQQAVAVLGLRNLLKIVYGIVLKQSLGGADAPQMARFWERSNYNAVVSAYLAGRLPGISSDDAYTFGLFHDAGISILMQKFPDYRQTLAQANAAPLAFASLEDERHHTNHVVVGALLARNWYLPEQVVWAVRYHHEPSVFTAPGRHATPDVCLLVAIRLISEHIVARFLGYPDDAEWECHKEAALAHLGWFEDDIDDLARGLAVDLKDIQAYRGG